MKIFLIIFFLNYGWHLRGVQSCQTPDGKDGDCMLIDFCDFISDKMTPNMSNQEKIFISRHVCGKDDGEIMVCCPVETDLTSRWTPDTSLLPSFQECDNTLVDRIYGGNVTKITDFPSMVLIKYNLPMNRFKLGCGGTLINNRYVVTAGHCVHKDSIDPLWKLNSVRLGEWNIETEVDCDDSALGEPPLCSDAYQDVLIANIIIHPEFDPATLKNDIALLRLAREVKYSTYIKPACLPLTQELRKEKTFRLEMIVVGFGKTETAEQSNKKLMVAVNGVRMSSCRKLYNRSILSTNICAGGEPGKDSCNGDSGGPLYKFDTKTNPFRPYWLLTGIVSYGPTRCGLSGFPGVYTRVSQYIPFILNNIAK